MWDYKRSQEYMNKRIVLIDQEETPQYLNYYGAGLGTNIYTLQSLDRLPKEDILDLGKGDAVMLVGSKPFSYLRNLYHFGIRGENYFDCSKLRRLSIEGGAYVKVVVDFPAPEDIADFMSPEFSDDVDFSWFQQKVLHTYEESMRFLDYLLSLPAETMYGFDYEASGMALDKQFELSGVSVCTIQYGGFISLTDLRHNSTAEEYQEVLQKLRYFLEQRMDHVWTYNMQYEFQVSRRMLGADLYNLRDAAVINVLDGHHMKKYSLKWTAQRVLEAKVWDTDFDRISELIDSMLFTEEGKLKKDKHKVLKVTPSDFKNTPEWQELGRKYPSFIGEFESLLLEYWGNPFMCIPSTILGYYCNLDAFYTLMLYEARKDTYTQEAFDVFTDNIRLACRLHSCGIPKDEKFRKKYDDYCDKQMVWGITYCAEARCKIKMRKHLPKAASLDKYPEVSKRLLRSGNFFGGDVNEITKYILTNHIDTLDAYELGINEGSLLLDYGPDFSTAFLDKTKEAMLEAGMIKTMRKTGEVRITKLDSGVGKKRKIIEILGEKLIPLLGLDKIKIGPKHVELEKYLYYERAYNELMKLTKTQLSDINNIPNTIRAFGYTYNLKDFSDFVSNNYFKCKSPEEDVEICKEYATLYKAETAYLTALADSTQQLSNAEKYYEALGIKTVEEGFAHFMTEWEKYYNGVNPIDTDYPEKMYKLAWEYYYNLDHDRVRETWNNFNGYKAQADLFPYVNDQCEDYEKVFDEADLSNNFFFMRKFTLNYLRYKKHSKLKSTYVGDTGMFSQSDAVVLEDPNSHLMLREADPEEPGSIVKMRPHFSCMEKSSKRWSSGYHTIISHSDIKRTVCSYPGHLLTYFDIN